MKKIEISTDVFAQIWSRRQSGEESEDEILRRILKQENTKSIAYLPSEFKDIGFFDKRNNLKFPKGFIIFRYYKDVKYAAKAINGKWQREDNGGKFTSINQLNESIVSGNENVWNGNWKFKNSLGLVLSIDQLRT